MNKLISKRNRLSSILLLLASICMPSMAQTVDTAIIGTVTDSTGAVIGGATVTATATATGVAKSAVTSSTGAYSITYLIPGTYDLKVSANGFNVEEEKGIVLQINQQAKMNVSLHVGGVSQVVEVAATPPLLQTEDASLGVVVGTESAANLPLDGRKFDDLAILTPGVTFSDPDDHTSSEGGSSINSYGNQVTWGQTNIDGVTMVSNRHAYVNLYPSVDAIAEFKVYTGNAEAEYGGGAGAVTNIQLKSGTNSFHGDLFEFVRNTDMDARNFFIVSPIPKQVLKQNQFGGTFGGPIIKDKTFFFGSYEGLRSVEFTAGISNVLTPAEITGDFSALLPGTVLKSPCTGLPYTATTPGGPSNPGGPATNKLPGTNTTGGSCPDSLSTVAQNIAKNYMPAQSPVTVNGDNYSYFTGGDESVDQYILRLDHKINDTNQLAFHFLYAYRNFPEVLSDPVFKDTGTFPIYNMGLQYVHTFTPNLLNELRLGWEYEHQSQFTTLKGTSFTPASIGINGFGTGPNGGPPAWPAPEEGFPSMGFNEILGIGSGGIGLDNGQTFQLVDNLTWVKGKQTLIFGGDIRHNQDNADTSNTPYGSITFNGSETGFDGADFMIGVPSSLITPEGDPLTASRQWRLGFYAQDNYKVSPNLTANIGLRWDEWAVPHNELTTSGDINWTTSPPSLEAEPNPLWTISHKDFGPRVGLAYSLPHQMVVRAAYGMTFYGGQFDNINILQLNPPVDPSFSLTNGNSPSNPPTAQFSNMLGTGLAAAVANVVSTEPDGKHPDLYLETWNLTLSKQFWNNVLDVTYVGVKGEHQDTSLLNYNIGPPQFNTSAPNKTTQQDRPYPTFGQMRVLDYHGASMYEGFTARLEHRMSHGLNLTAAYTWSRLRDNQGGDTNGSRNETQIATAKVWANGLTDERDNLAIAFVWQLPKVTNGYAAERAILNGWGINTIYHLQSGSPLYVSQSSDGQSNGNNFEYPDLAAGETGLAASQRTIGQWFNTSAFTEAIGHYGTAPRNPGTLAGPVTDPLTLAINRSFPLPIEGNHLDFRAEAFNALNNPQFGAPGATCAASATPSATNDLPGAGPSCAGHGSFGKVTKTAVNNREIQLVLKYFF